MKAQSLLLLCGVLLSGTVFADISYNYIDVGYNAVTVDVPAPLDGDGAGPQIAASFELPGPFTVFAGGRQLDFSKDNIELDDINFGLGWNHALGTNASTFLNLAYLHTNVSIAGAPDYDQDGYGLTLGYRAENRSPWEFIGTVDYINVESGVEFGGGVTLVYDAVGHFSVVGGVAYFDQSLMSHLGVRYFLSRKH